MKINVEQVWEYELKPTDTFRLVQALKNAWKLMGYEFTLERRGDRMFAVRRDSGERDMIKEAFGNEPFSGFPAIRKD